MNQIYEEKPEPTILAARATEQRGVSRPDAGGVLLGLADTPGPATAARRSPPAVSLLLPFAIALPLLLMAASAWFSWRQAWREAEAEVTRTAEAGAEYARRVLDGFLLRLDRADEMLAGLSDEDIRAREGDYHAALRAIGQRTRDDNEQHVFLHDRDARTLVSGAIFPAPPLSEVFMDRDYNQALRGPDAPPVYLGKVFVGRVLDRPFFSVARRRERGGNGLPPGAYDGVVVVSPASNAMSAGLRRLLPGDGDGSTDVLALVRDDGQVLARSTGMTGPLPPATFQHPVARAVANGATRGTALVRSGVDGVERLSALRRVDGWPAIASVARPRSAIVARWRDAVGLQLAFGVPAMLALVGLALRVRRRERDLATANAGLEERIAARTAELRDREAVARNALTQLDAVYSTAPVGLCVLDLEGRYKRVNAGLAEMNGVPVEAHIGRTIREVVPGIADACEDVLRRVVETGQPVLGLEIEGETPAQPLARRAWIVDYSPIRDEAGRIIAVNVVAREVTEERAAARALAESEARLREGAQRLSTLVDALPLGVGLCDADGRLLVANAALRRFVPELIPSRDEARRNRWRSYRQDGSLLDCSDFPGARALRGEMVVPGMELLYTEEDGAGTWTRVLAVPLRDMVGVTGAVLIVADITEQKASEEQRALLMREVDHRAKNALSVVLAALRLTRKDDADAYAQAVEGRVGALARAHTMLAEGRWERAPLRELVEAELAVFQPGLGEDPARMASEERVTVDGPDLALAPDAVQAVSMVLHELATNATKYGALSVREGHVRVTWRVDRVTGNLILIWRERGGPRVQGPPERRGFGSRVIEATLGNQLGGGVERRWEEDGLVCVMTVPVARALASGAATAA
ncbi:PAS domain-containing protein [Falsiroseomonas sp. HW251]|uniref:PAS domain-containing protein n=1 Tax=Falsiroseomonas sp. HW251 TaxID=3390998 RepID=UPI003D31C2A6